MALLVTVDGTTRAVTPENGRDFKLGELYKLLGCDLVEIISLGHGQIMVIDEEGKCADKPVNHEATKRAAHVISAFDCIVGDALVCLSREVR